MYCLNCGKQIDDHDNFCRFCGQKSKTEPVSQISTSPMSKRLISSISIDVYPGEQIRKAEKGDKYGMILSIELSLFDDKDDRIKSDGKVTIVVVKDDRGLVGFTSNFNKNSKEKALNKAAYKIIKSLKDEDFTYRSTFQHKTELIYFGTSVPVACLLWFETADGKSFFDMSITDQWCLWGTSKPRFKRKA